MLKDKLQMFLVTYNRKEHLENTLKQIFSENSPVKNFDITILNNNSNDGTDEVIEEYRKKFPNIEHIKHHVNIGGNPNICRAIELAILKNKEYTWMICDDDDYDFSSWNKVEEAVNNKKDFIMVSYVQDADKINKYSLVNECSFLPAVIYRTEYFTSTVLQNAYMNTYHCFPHSAIICSLVNNNHMDYEIVEPLVVIQNWHRPRRSFVRGISAKEVHFKQARTNLLISHINIYHTIKNKKYRYKCCKYLWLNKSFLYSCYKVWQQNKNCIENLADFFWGISFRQKLIFLIAPLISPVYYRLKYYLKCLYLFAKTDILK